MLQQDALQDYVIATGVQYSVREFIEKAASALDIAIRWEGNGKEVVGIVDSLSAQYPELSEGTIILRIDPKYFRPSEVETLLGNREWPKINLAGYRRLRSKRWLKRWRPSTLTRLNGTTC